MYKIYMNKIETKPTFLQNVDMMVNDTIDKINIDSNISKILKTCRICPSGKISS